MTQTQIQVPTTPPLSGAALVSSVNDALMTLGTDFAGATDPAAVAQPFMTWADTGNGRLKRRNEAGTQWVDLGPLFSEPATPPDGALYASQAWVSKKLAAFGAVLPRFALDAIPATDVGDIFVNGLGHFVWDAAASAYFKKQDFSTLITYTASGSITIPSYIRKVRLSGCAGGGGGGSYGGGGSGASLIDHELDVGPGATYMITIGGGGSSGNPGAEGGATSFGDLILSGGGRGSSSGGAGGTGPAGSIAGQSGTGASGTEPGGAGGSTPFGAGASPNPGGSVTLNNAAGYGSGGRGGRGGADAGPGQPGILWVRY